MTSANAPGTAFGALAPTYDATFTSSSIGMAQRDAVLRSAFCTCRGRLRLLELNCGTGIDASRFAEAGWEVLATDASNEMIQVAETRSPALQRNGKLKFRCMAIEDVRILTGRFDAVFSNFSGLNCLSDLAPVAQALASITAERSPLVLCLSSRFCVWEAAWYLLRCRPDKAFRRWSGFHRASISGSDVDVHYPLLRDLRRNFAPHFRLEHVQAVGLFVPPSYVERYAARLPRLLRVCVALDALLARLPGLRVLGDHMLLTFRKNESA